MDKIELKSERWDEGAPLGNGKIGSIVYGSNPLKITVDRADLWDLRPNEVTLEKGFNFANLVRLSTSGKKEDWQERARLFEDIFMGKPYPSKITAGRLELFFNPALKDARYTLDISSAKVNVYDGNELVAEVFTDYISLVGVIKLYREAEVKFHIPAYLTNLSENGSGIGSEDVGVTLGYPVARIKQDGGYARYEQDTHTEYSFGIVIKKVGDEVYYTLATTDDDKDYVGYAEKALSAAAEIGFDGLYKEHARSWKKYCGKSSVKTGDKLLDETYKKSWYLFRCCSRKGYYPMPLQGVWTADNDALPPWKGDYHHDTNTELSYQSYLKANRLDEGEAFIDYLWKLKPTFEKFAEEFFATDGLLIPSCSTADGKPMGGWAQYSLSPTMTVWAAQSFDEYYLYTGDEKFLSDRAYPFFKEVGSAIKGLLREKDGKLYLPVSTSPEIFDNEPEAYLKPNSNFDLALLKYLYKTLAGYCSKLGLNGEEYNEILSKLDDFAIDENGVVMLDKERYLPETHRHFSHVTCLYPLHLINYDTKEHKEIYENTILNLETLGTGYWVGFSFAASAQIYAMAKNGNAAIERLSQFCKGFVAKNGFHLNGDYKRYGYTWFHYRPFTLESLYGFCDALHETLLQDHTENIELFPAVPDEWKRRGVSFDNLRSRGGLLISAEAKGGEIVKLKVKSLKDDSRVTINGETYVLKRGENKLI